jgi:hypothetical protein
MFDK